MKKTSKLASANVAYVVFTADNRVLTGYFFPEPGREPDPSDPSYAVLGALGASPEPPETGVWYACLAAPGTPAARRPLRYIDRAAAERISQKIPGAYVDTVSARPL